MAQAQDAAQVPEADSEVLESKTRLSVAIVLSGQELQMLISLQQLPFFAVCRANLDLSLSAAVHDMQVPMS